MKRKATKVKARPTAPAILMRDPRSGVEVAVLGDDGPTPQRAQHDKIDTGWRAGIETGRSRRVVDSLTLMHRAGTISDDMLVAGLRFRADFDRAHLEGHRTSNLVRTSGSAPKQDLPISVIEARDRVAAAIDRLGGHGSPLAEVCWWVVGAGVSIREFSVRQRWSGRALHVQQAAGLIQGALSILRHLTGNRLQNQRVEGVEAGRPGC